MSRKQLSIPFFLVIFSMVFLETLNKNQEKMFHIDVYEDKLAIKNDNDNRSEKSFRTTQKRQLHATTVGNGIGYPAEGKNEIDRNHLGGAGVFSIVAASLAGAVGLGLCLYGFKKPPIPAPIAPGPIQPIITPEVVVPQQPIVITNAQPVIPSPMPQPLPTPILPPPRPVPIMPQPVVVPIPQPVVVPIAQPVQVIQPTPYIEQVVETPVVEPVVTTELVQPVQDIGIVNEFVQPIQDIDIVNEPYANQGIVGDFQQPLFTTGDQF